MRKIKKIKTTKSFSLRVFLHRMWVSFLILTAFSVFIFVVWAYHSGFAIQKWQLLTQTFHTTLKDAGFTLDEILITGRNRTPMNDICQILEIPEESCFDLKIPKGRSITTLDIQQIQKNFKMLPWVKDVIIHMQLPNILHIDLTEKKPIALWQKNEQYYPLDEQGSPINAVCLECGEYMLLVVGNNAPKQTPYLIEVLEKHKNIYNRTFSAKWVDNRRWNLYIDDESNQKIILLPDSDLEESISRLDNLQTEKQVLDKQIKQLDLRIDDRVIIKPTTKQSITSNQEKSDGK